MIWPLVATRLNRYLPVEPFLRTNLAAIYLPNDDLPWSPKPLHNQSRRHKLAHQFRWRSAACPTATRSSAACPTATRSSATCLALQPGQPRPLIHPRHLAVARLPPQGRPPSSRTASPTGPASMAPQQTQVKSSGPRGPESQVGTSAMGRCRSKSAVCCGRDASYGGLSVGSSSGDRGSLAKLKSAWRSPSWEGPRGRRHGGEEVVLDEFQVGVEAQRLVAVPGV